MILVLVPIASDREEHFKKTAITVVFEKMIEVIYEK